MRRTSALIAIALCTVLLASACENDGDSGVSSARKRSSASPSMDAGRPPATQGEAATPAPTKTGASTRPPRGSATSQPQEGTATPKSASAPITKWVYQLQNYPNGRLDQIAATPAQAAVIDPARDASRDYFSTAEINAVKATGKKVFGYFEIGSIENFRPEYKAVNDAGLTVQEWKDWPGEYWVRYWDAKWWELAVKPRVDEAIDHGFDGVYLDTPLAYEELDLAKTNGETRDSLAQKMVNLIVHISQYAKGRNPNFWVIPQNSPELRHVSGYTDAIDGIGMEELYYTADDEHTDMPCKEDWCAENLANVRALRDAGKQVLAVDYAVRDTNVKDACATYTRERFAGYVTTRALDTVKPSC